MDAKLFNTLRGFKVTSRKLHVSDDDFVDRLNRYHTVLLFVLMSIIICAKQYVVGEPLQCWVPAEFTGAWEQYAENYCWVQNTYFVKPKDELHASKTARSQTELHYYQWVPFVLAAQALFFCIPNAIWHLLNWQSGVPIRSLIEKASEANAVGSDCHDANMDLLARHFSYAVMREDRNRNSGILVLLKRCCIRLALCGFSKSGTYLISNYLIIKVLYLANIILQFLIIDLFLGTPYHLFGFQVLNDLANGRGWEHTGHFPRVTMCDFTVTDKGHTRPYSVECVLVINMFSEKIYLFIWFWLLLIFIATLLGFFSWFIWFCMRPKQISYLEKYLSGSSPSLRDLDNFLDSLTSDGVFILQLIERNVGDIVVKDLVERLYQIHEAKQKEKAANESGAPFLKFQDDY